MHLFDRVDSLDVVPRDGRLSAFELAELHKLERWKHGVVSVDQAAMERLSERGYVRRGLRGWRPTVPGLLALSRR